MARHRWGVEDGDVGSFPTGATLRSGDIGWVLVGDRPSRRLGGCLAWARQQRVAELHVLVDDPAAAGVLARRAALFVTPPVVWRVDGVELTLVLPAAPPELAVVPPTSELFRPLLTGSDLEVATEQGQLLGEVLGLEVARVVTDQGSDGSDAHLEVGVGRFDREAFALMNEGLTDSDALAKAATVVREIRRPNAPRHQLNQLSRERWLRSALVAEPALVGARQLSPVESALPRTDLKSPAPATAIGTDPNGRPLVVVASCGVDLDLVPTAADDRLLYDPDARLILALPGPDVLPVTEALSAALVRPADIVTVQPPW